MAGSWPSRRRLRCGSTLTVTCMMSEVPKVDVIPMTLEPLLWPCRAPSPAEAHTGGALRTRHKGTHCTSQLHAVQCFTFNTHEMSPRKCLYALAC